MLSLVYGSQLNNVTVRVGNVGVRQARLMFATLYQQSTGSEDVLYGCVKPLFLLEPKSKVAEASARSHRLPGIRLSQSKGVLSAWRAQEHHGRAVPKTNLHSKDL